MKPLRKVEDHAIEDVFGTEIIIGDRYWIFGEDVVSDVNLKQYLIEKQQVPYFVAVE